MKSPSIPVLPSPEMSLLCACLGPVRSGAMADALSGRRPVDWPRFLSLATSHHVIPSAYQALKTAAQEDGAVVPGEFLSYLHREYMAIAAHNLRATDALCRLQRLLAQEGIPLVPIKGPALAILAYGSTSMRQFEDLDVLVRPGDLLRAVGLLEREGYVAREIPLRANRVRYGASLQDWSMQRPGGGAHLDLKPVLISHTLCGPASVEYMAKASRPISTGGGPELLAPGPEAMFLAVCLDGANEMWFKLSSIADAARLLAAFPAADWEGLWKEAGPLGHRRSLRVGAALAELLMGGPLPELFREVLRQDPAARRLAAEAARRVQTEVSLRTSAVRQIGFALRTRDRWRDRWRLLSRLLWVPGAADLHLIVLPDILYPIYSFIRPFRLAWDALRGRPRRIGLAEGSHPS